jgi:hypothetical protein
VKAPAEVIAAVAVKEGIEAWQGEGCACMADPLASQVAADGDGRRD